MRRIIIFTGAALATALATQAIIKRSRSETTTSGADKYGQMAEKCEGMLAKMPDSFPPNRMMTDLEQIKTQTAQILDEVHKSKEPHEEQHERLILGPHANHEPAPSPQHN